VGGGGVDILRGGAGDDELWGGDQADQLWGGADNDFIRAGAQNDTIFADAGNDKIFGEDGTDTYRYKGDAIVTGAPNSWDAAGVSLTLGNETITTPTGSATNAILTGSATGADTLVGVEIVELTDGNDTVIVQPGYDKITDTILIDGLGGRNILNLQALDKKLTFDGDHIVGSKTTFKGFEVLRPTLATTLSSSKDRTHSPGKRSISVPATTRSTARSPASRSILAAAIIP